MNRNLLTLIETNHLYPKVMRKIKFLVIAILSLYGSQNMSNAQGIDLSIDDIVRGPYKKFKANQLDQLQWLSSSAYIYQKDTTIYMRHIDTEMEVSLLSLFDINKALKLPIDEGLTSLPMFSVVDSATLIFKYTPVFFYFNLNTKQVQHYLQLPENAADINFSPDFASVAYTVDNNLYINRIKQN